MLSPFQKHSVKDFTCCGACFPLRGIILSGSELTAPVHKHMKPSIRAVSGGKSHDTNANAGVHYFLGRGLAEIDLMITRCFV